MTQWQQEYFQKFSYTRHQILKYLSSARKDLSIAKKSKIDEVRFQFTYNAFLKLGISLIACHSFKVRSRSGHHIKILEQTALILNDENIAAYGNQMRKTRNSELYNGTMSITKKQTDAYFHFVEKTFKQAEPIFKKHLHSLF